MRVPHDIHPGDLAARRELAAQLTAAREEAGWTGYDLDRATGVSLGSTNAFESRTTWEVSTAQVAARIRGRRLELLLVGLVAPDDFDVIAAVYEIADRSTAERHDKTHLRTVCNDLVRTRRAAGLSARKVAQRIGITESAVYFWEANPDGTSVASVQRYARALTEDLTSHVELVLHRAPIHLPRARPAA